MGKYDIEQAITDIQGYLQANLNNQLAAVAADKADGLDLPPLDPASYFLHGLDERCITLDPFLVIYIEDTKSNGQGPMTSKAYEIHVVVVLTNKQDQQMPKRMLRYQRALEEIFEGGWDKICNGNKLKVQSLVPIALRLFDSSNDYRALGVSLELNLA